MGWKAIVSLFPMLRGDPAGTEPEGGPIKVYVFREWNGATGRAAPAAVVRQAFGDLETFTAYFGGYSAYGRIFRSAEFLGVWGSRHTARFRRILRERVGELDIVHANPPVRCAGSNINGRRLDRKQRETLEEQFRARGVTGVSPDQL